MQVTFCPADENVDMWCCMILSDWEFWVPSLGSRTSRSKGTVGWQRFTEGAMDMDMEDTGNVNKIPNISKTWKGI